MQAANTDLKKTGVSSTMAAVGSPDLRLILDNDGSGNLLQLQGDVYGLRYIHTRIFK